jgi:hypothetical protein
MQARSAVERGESPAQTKRSGKERLTAAKTFCEQAEEWFDGAGLAHSTKAMRRGVYNRDISRIAEGHPFPAFEISSEAEGHNRIQGYAVPQKSAFKATALVSDSCKESYATQKCAKMSII